jgi:hypothetical protein
MSDTLEELENRVDELGLALDSATLAAREMSDCISALESRVDQLTATVDGLKGSMMNVLVSRSAAPYNFPASDVRAGMAPAGFTVATTPPATVLWGQIRDWSKATFGPGRRTKGLLEHIRRELDEVAANPDDLVEWVDVVLLAFDGYWRHGGTPEGFMDMVRYKFSVNQARKWPPPAPDDQPNHHVEEPTAPALEPRRAGWRKRAQEALGDPASSARSCAGPAPHATRVSTRPRTDRGVGAALTPNWKRSAQNPADRSRAGRARSGRASAGTSWAAIWARNQCACPRSWTRRRPGA